MLTLLVCVAIAVLTMPAVLSALNNNHVEVAPDSTSTEGETLLSDGGTSWATTEVVSTESTGNSYNPSLAVDPSGNIHVAWHDYTDYSGSGTDQDIFYKRYDVGVGWTTTEVVSTESTSTSGYSSLLVDSAGNIHVAWHDYTDYGGSGTDEDIFYKRYEVGVGWTVTEVVSTESTSDSYDPSLAVDSSGNIHIAWTDNTDYSGCGADTDMFYKRYEMGVGWTTTEVVSTESTGNSYYPSLAVDPSGNIHVAWYDFTDYSGSGTDRDIFYKRYEVGVGWTVTEVVSTESTDISYNPWLAVDSAGDVHVAWQDYTDYGGSGIDEDIFYRRYEMGVGWTVTEVVSTESTGNSYTPSLAVDPSGNIHVAWYDSTDYGGSGIDDDIFYKRYDVGVDWTTTEVVSTESTGNSRDPSLAVDSSGNIHIAWEDTTNYGGSGADWDIFYKRSEFALLVEPASLKDIVDFPSAAHLKDIYEATYPPDWGTLTTTEVVSTESTGVSYDPSLAVDSSGNIHIAWYDLTDYGGSGTDYDIFYKRYEVGVGWTTTEVVSTESTGNSRDPSLAVDSSGNIHIAWHDSTDYGGSGTDADIFYKQYEMGVGWTTTEVVSTESTGTSGYSSLSVDSAGNVHVAWHDSTDYGGSGTDYDIFYKRYEVGVGWTTAEVVSTESTGSSFEPSLAVDSSGNIHIAWYDSTDYGGSGTDYDIFYKQYEMGVGWTTTEVVSTESTGLSNDPSLAVDSSGNIHIAWFDSTDYGGSGTDYDIFYKQYEMGVGWTTTEVVSTESTSHSYYPWLSVDSAGNVHIAWQDVTNYGDSGTDYDIFYKRYEVGVGWTTTEVVSTESTSSSQHPWLSVDSLGNVHIAWYDSTDYGGFGTDDDIFYKRSGPDKYWTLTKIMTTVEGLPEMKSRLESQGFTFDPAASNVSLVDGGLDSKAFGGTVLSWWSSNMDTSGRMAFIVAAQMNDGKTMVFGAITNLIPPEILLEAGKYIIVNAMPCTIIQYFYYDTLNNRIVNWSSWWYESQSQPNWFWGIYWKWRTYIKEYYGPYSYIPWWWWLWHYTYDKQWHNWGAESPY